MAARKKDTDNYENIGPDNNESNMNTDTDVPDGQVSKVTVVADDPEATIMLDASLSIQNVVKLYEKIKNSYSAYNTIEINASRVYSIDTATLQLLAALKKDAVKQQKEVVFTAPSPRFIESAGLLGLLEILDVDT